MSEGWQPTTAQRGVARDAAAAYGLTHSELLAHRRHNPRPSARFAAVWALRTRWPKLTNAQLAIILARDTSTISHNYYRACDERKGDPDFRAITDALVAATPVPLAPLPEAVTAKLLRAAPARRRLDIRERNDFGADTWCAAALVTASANLLSAIRREHPERFAA